MARNTVEQDRRCFGGTPRISRESRRRTRRGANRGGTTSTRYQFIENLPAAQPAGEPVGHVDALDPLSAQARWRTPLWDHPHWSAILATGGGLLFTGKETGEFIALDADSGALLWQFQTGSGINAQPITYTRDGRQYVTVLSGIGGVYWNQAREQLKNVPQGGSVWTSALMRD